MYKKLSIALCFAISFAITMQPVSLAAGYPDSYVTNDILWYKENDSTTCSGSSSNGVSGSDNQQLVPDHLLMEYQYLITKKRFGDIYVTQD